MKKIALIVSMLLPLVANAENYVKYSSSSYWDENDVIHAKAIVTSVAQTNAGAQTFSTNVLVNGRLQVQAGVTNNGITDLIGAVRTATNVTVGGALTVTAAINVGTGIAIGAQSGWTGVITNNGTGVTNYTWVGKGIVTNVTYLGAP
jgi:hypothetical protein